VHEGGISTPLIAHWPKGIKAKGALRHSPSHVIDIVPTILEMAGIPKPTSWKNQKVPTAPGKSLVPAFASDVTIQRDNLWWFHDGHRAVRQGDFKLVSAKNQAWELYNLKTDRAESKNLVNQKPKLKEKLEKLWNDQVEEFKKLY
jgi:arylsulfatase